MGVEPVSSASLLGICCRSLLSAGGILVGGMVLCGFCTSAMCDVSYHILSTPQMVAHSFATPLGLQSSCLQV